MTVTTSSERGVRKTVLRVIRSYLFGNYQATIGFSLVLIFVAVSVIVGLTGYNLLPFNPIQQYVGSPFSAPSLKHWFGTDEIGRDVFSRIVAATPNDALISFTVIAAAFVTGGVLGVLSGYKKGLIDEALMRVTDVFFALPSIVLAMVVAVALGPGLIHMMYALIIVWWPTYARLSRAEALKTSQYYYVEAARISGIPTRIILFRHIFPNVFGTLFTYATLDIGTVVLSYAGLSYLGLSIQPPFPDWGNMVAAYQEYIISAPWLPLIPGLITTIVVIAFSLLGDGLRAAQRTR